MRAPRPLFVAALLAGLLAVPTAASAATRGAVISIAAGAHARVAVDAPITRIALGNPKVASATVASAREILLLGLAPGTTSLMVWPEAARTPLVYRVSVSADQAGLLRVLDADEGFRHVRLANHLGYPSVEGYVETTEIYERLHRLARQHLGDAYLDDVRVLQRTMVSVEVRIAALSVSTVKRLGFDFRYLGHGFQIASLGPSGGGFSFDRDSGLSVTSGLPISSAFNLLLSLPNVDFLAILGALSGTRSAQILAEPTLIVRSGESADVIAGGEIPIPVPASDGNIGIEFRKFGVQLRLSATVLSPERIVLKLAPEVSELDFSRAVTIGGTTVPALATRAASTTLELGDGQSFVLAGLLSGSRSNQDEKLPYLGDVPILGAFFKRVENTRERQELVIIATPRLVSPLQTNRPLAMPGDRLRDYDPTIADHLLNLGRLDKRLARHGLLP